LLGVLGRYNVQVYQLPCPEYLFLGIREKRSQDMWAQLPGFVQFVRDLADSLVKTIKPLTGEESLPLIGIARSPCCSFSKVYHGTRLVNGWGLWVKELEGRIPVDAVEFDYKLIEQSLSGVERILSRRANST
jgi:predicted secreted protein